MFACLRSSFRTPTRIGTHYLCADPVLLSLLNAPADDEPYTDEQRQRDAEAEASIAGGGGISHEKILSEFGI